MNFADIPNATTEELRSAWYKSARLDEAIRSRFRNTHDGLIPRNQIGVLDELDREQRLQTAIEDELHNRRNGTTQGA